MVEFGTRLRQLRKESDTETACGTDHGTEQHHLIL